MIDDDRACAQVENGRQVVGDEDERYAAVDQLAHPFDAAILERRIADAEHLVDQQDVGIEMRGNRETEARVHAGRVALDLRVDELADAGELDDLIELARDLGALHPHDRALQEHVLPTGQIGMKSGGHFNQRSGPPANLAVPDASA